MISIKAGKQLSSFEEKSEFVDLAFPLMDALFSTALRLTRNQLDAEDLVQDVYVRAFRFFAKFKRETNFKAWIFKILMNTFINQYRKKKSEPFKVQIDSAVHGLRVEESTQTFFSAFASVAPENLFDDEITASLESLSDDFRLVVLLADVESFSYKEISKMLNCPIGTVMSRLSRARKQLQIQLQEYGVNAGYIKSRERD